MVELSTNTVRMLVSDGAPGLGLNHSTAPRFAVEHYAVAPPSMKAWPFDP
jgi:hypothetical protein